MADVLLRAWADLVATASVWPAIVLAFYALFLAAFLLLLVAQVGRDLWARWRRRRDGGAGPTATRQEPPQGSHREEGPRPGRSRETRGGVVPTLQPRRAGARRAHVARGAEDGRCARRTVLHDLRNPDPEYEATRGRKLKKGEQYDTE